jgi:hypothetical protein
MKHVANFLFFSYLLISCTPAVQPSQAEVLKVYATSAAGPWMTELYACAAKSAVVLEVNAQAPDIYLRVGEPQLLISTAYQIDEEEILIVTNRESPIQNLSLEDAQNLFALGIPDVPVWVYSSGEDVQLVFDQLVMKGRSVTSFAKIAYSQQSMSDVLNSGSNGVGILSRHWKTGNVRDVFSVGTVPVLAVTKAEPQGVVRDLISCLQSN